MSAQKVCPQCNGEYELDQRFCPKDGSTLKMVGGSSSDLLGQIIADRYLVLKKLGAGGMGTVYLAEHVKMGRKSAVKVMNPGALNDADAISRFNREAQNASRINHANVAAVYDFGETGDGMTYLAMEFIEGPSLSKVIEDAGSLPPLRAADITRQASEALAVAHDMGIVHRDLKPDNIMLAKGRDGADVVKVVDFGIAKAAAEENQKVTKTGMVVGTPEYMSPEQLSGDTVDGRSDTYSLALVAFNMFTGMLPFPAATAQESMIARLLDPPKGLSEMKPEVAWTAEVQAVMDRALARDVAERYQTASAFGRELFAAVQAMASHDDVMSANTAVIAPVAGPARTAIGARKPTPVPATRVGSAAPNAGAAAVPAPVAPKSKSKTPMIAGGVGLLAVAGIVAFVMLKGGGSPTGPGASGAESLNLPVTSAPGIPASSTVNLPRELEAVASMPDSTAALAQAQIHRLEALDDAARNAPEATYTQYRFMRAKALLNLGDDTAGCDSLHSIQGRLAGTRFEQAAKPLMTYCKQRQFGPN
jgi:serine/threonine-protein kinase